MGEKSATWELLGSAFIVSLETSVTSLAFGSAGHNWQASWLEKDLLSRQIDPTRSAPEPLPVPLIPAPAQYPTVPSHYGVVYAYSAAQPCRILWQTKEGLTT